MTTDIVKQIRRAIRRRFTSEEKIRGVLEGLRGEIPITDLCRKEGIQPSIYSNGKSPSLSTTTTPDATTRPWATSHPMTCTSEDEIPSTQIRRRLKGVTLARRQVINAKLARSVSAQTVS